MQAQRNTFLVGIIAFSMLAWASVAAATVTPVTGWVVHNGTSTVGGTASNPTFTAADNIVVMAPFTDVALVNDGDFVQGKVTLTVTGRTGSVLVNTLNTQLRFGLFYNNASAVVTANDVPNLGYTIEYTNLAAGGLSREQTNVAQTNPFTSPAGSLTNGVQDSGGDSIQGANPGAVTFDIKITRNAGKIDLLGSISGTDSVSGNPYLATFTSTGYTPTSGTFTFNRMALFLGDNVNGGSASLVDSTITTVPEPMGLAFTACVIGGLAARRRGANHDDNF
jgi:hypothetical protein